MAKSGQADILELLFRTGIFKILAKTLITGEGDFLCITSCELRYQRMKHLNYNTIRLALDRYGFFVIPCSAILRLNNGYSVFIDGGNQSTLGMPCVQPNPKSQATS